MRGAGGDCYRRLMLRAGARVPARQLASRRKTWRARRSRLGAWGEQSQRASASRCGPEKVQAEDGTVEWVAPESKERLAASCARAQVSLGQSCVRRAPKFHCIISIFWAQIA